MVPCLPACLPACLPPQMPWIVQPSLPTAAVAPAPPPLPLPAKVLQGAASQGPCILVHPLENIQEVQMAAGSSSSGGGNGGEARDGSGAGGGWDEQERVVWSGAEVPYLVTHNTVGGAVGGWALADLKHPWLPDD